MLILISKLSFKETEIIDKSQTKQHLKVKYQIKKHIASQNHSRNDEIFMEIFHLENHSIRYPENLQRYQPRSQRAKRETGAINLHSSKYNSLPRFAPFAGIIPRVVGVLGPIVHRN